MTHNFAFDAPQFVDFSNGLHVEDTNVVESYFEIDHEVREKRTETITINIDDSPQSVKDAELEFYSPMQSPFPTKKPEIPPENPLRRSVSTGNLLKNDPHPVEKLNGSIQSLHIEKKNSSTRKRLVSMATIPYSPALKTKQRVRPVTALSRQEQEIKEMEDAKKFKIKAKPVNTKILYGPVKPQVPVERKPPTKIEPFKITAVKKPAAEPQEESFHFHANPVPKSVLEPPKQPVKMCTRTVPQSPNFSKRWSNRSSKDETDKCVKTTDTKDSSHPFKPVKTQPMPFSFEKRDKEIIKRKEELFNKIVEEERKAREFHARPPPKHIFRSPQTKTQVYKQRNTSQGSINRTYRSNESVCSNGTFKARPPTVLFKEPFVPKKLEHPLTEITKFELNTDRRAKEREAFEEQLRLKQELMEQHRKSHEEEMRRLEQEEIARIRKEAEHKAQPIRQFKGVVLPELKKCTVPISPNFASKVLNKNKENKINQSH